MHSRYILLLCLFLLYSSQLSSQCHADIEVAPNGLGGYSFSAVNLADTSAWVEYNWSIDSITIDSNTRQTTFTFGNNGTYNICLHVSDTATICAFDTCITITVEDAEYYPLLDSINIWRYRDNLVPIMPMPNLESRSHNCSYPIGGSGAAASLSEQRTEGDSIIDGKKFKILNLHRQWWHPCLLGFIREDTINRKVFFVDNNLSPEILLYDFAMKIGDTIPIGFLEDYPNNYFRSGTYRLDSILWRTINGVSRRFFFLNNVTQPVSQTLIWCEGVGNLGELIYPYSANGDGWSFYLSECPWFPHDFFKFMICFEHNESIYHDSCAYQASLLAQPCIYVVDSCNYSGFCGAIEKLSSVSSFIVSPNPASDNIVIDLDIKQAGVFGIVVSDLQGREITTEKTLGHLSEGKHNAIIPISNFSNGLYLIGCKTTEGILYQKLVVSK